ncbi:MAG: hypothetical protein PHZ09_00965 [Eubacteriales bacterium]|jgi:hypothetical protein|nr:hypothetical protein [Eubacteriales bacterium]
MKLKKIISGFIAVITVIAMISVWGCREPLTGIYSAGGYISRTDYPLSEASVLRASQKFNKIYDDYLSGMNVYYAVVPDKNYFIAGQNGYAALDYAVMLDMLRQNLKEMSYIDIFDTLSIESYYYTDIHWRQEKIIPTAEKLLDGMGSGRADVISYTENRLYPFRGSYYNDYAGAEPETLIYLTGGSIDGATVYNHTSEDRCAVYDPDKSADDENYGYNIFLSGPVPLITIETAGGGSRELLLFRDSFGSSIAPLLLEGYSKITLIDLRYIYSGILESFIDFEKSENQDVLFLYGTQVLNNSFMFK